MCEPNCKHAMGCTEVDGLCFEGGNGCFSEAEAAAPPPVSPSNSPAPGYARSTVATGKSLMAKTNENDTLAKTWELTMGLRIVKPVLDFAFISMSQDRLQQAWQCRETDEIEWRDVEIVRM